MAGGGESGLTDSLLETPTYVLSIVFMMFLAVSGAFEITHHFARKALVRRGRLGMADALDKIVMELTLLGFVSLILTAFASPLSHICVNYETSMDKWTMESSIWGCPCCLATTGGLSYCSLIQHDCRWNVTDRSPFCQCNITGSEAYYTAANPDAQAKLVDEDCLVFDNNEVTFFIESSVNTLATISVFTNSSVEDICKAIDEEYQVAEARQSLSLAEQLEEAGVDPNDGFVLPWDDTNGFRRRLAADGSGNSQRQQRRRRLQGAPLAAGAGQRPLAAEQPAARAGVGPPQHGCQPRAPQHNNRRLLGGDMGDRVTDPLSVLAAARTDPNNPTAVHVLPRAKLFKCTGPFLSSGCPNGKVPAISASALHQVHIWLFLIAVTHVGTCVVQFMVATVRILLWRRWERLARQAAMPRSRAAKAASIVMADQHEAAEPPGLKEGSGKDVEPPSADGAPPSDVQAAAADAQAAAAAAAAGQAEQGTADSSPAGASLAAAASMAGSASQASSSGSQLRPSSLKKLQSRARFVWKFKPADFHEWGASGWLMEFAICLVQALWPNLVTRGNFTLMRKAWLAAGAQSMRRQDASLATSLSFSSGGGSSGGSSEISFVGHVLDCLEGDLTTFVGLSVEMGICLVVVVLLMGVTGNVGGVTLVCLACSLMLATNMALVALLRHQCRGAKPNRSRGRDQWWRNPHFVLAIPLRLLTFLCSFVFSSTAFFAWQFGSASCFFTSTWGLWSIWDLPWWSGIVIAVVIWMWASAATIPAYALAAHSRHRSLSSATAVAGGHHHREVVSRNKHMDAAQGQPPAAGMPENGVDESGAAPPVGSGDSSAEVGRLQAEVSRLQAHIAELQARLAAEPQPAVGEEDAAPPPSAA